MKVKDLLRLCGEKELTEVMLYDCDERESITVAVRDLLEDNRYNEALNGEIESWDYDYVDVVLCIYYFKEGE